jgi:hypothetical protein
VITDAHAPTTETVCQLTAATGDRTDNVAKHRRELLSQFWVDILNQRLGELARRENPPFLKAAASHTDGREADRSCVGVIVYREDWAGAEASVQTEVRRLASADPTDARRPGAICTPPSRAVRASWPRRSSKASLTSRSIPRRTRPSAPSTPRSPT